MIKLIVGKLTVYKDNAADEQNVTREMVGDRQQISANRER
jgi:hypothetical protein